MPAIFPRRSRVGVHWLFRSVFFVIILVATLLTAFVVLIDQGLYAALLMISVPIGATGFIKARFCPLVLKQPFAGYDAERLLLTQNGRAIWTCVKFCRDR
jgi:hypothetical protein